MRSNGKLLAGVLFCAVLVFSNAPQAYAYGGPGTGATNDPYEITSCSELQSISSNLAASYELMHDIDCAAYSIFPGFNPISGGDTFTGSFDGNGFTIDNLSIDPAGNPDNVSIFGAADGATLTNATLDHLTVKGGVNVGGLVGTANEMTISGITLRNGLIVGTEKVGGIVGSMNGYDSLLINSATDATTVKGSSTLATTSYIGGAMGYTQGSDIQAVSTKGSVIGNDHDTTMSEWVGGIAGYGGWGFDVYSLAAVTGGTYVGGLFGESRNMSYAYSAGPVTGEAYVGGLSGIGYYSFYSFSVSPVSGNADTVGGIYGAITEYATFVTFFAGTLMDPAKSGQAACFGIPDINTDTFAAMYEPECQSHTAGVTGADYFYDTTETSPFGDGSGINWDFDTIWRTLPTDYPVLRSAPGTPSNIQAAPSVSSVALSWDPPAAASQAPLTGYVLEYAESGTSAMTTVTDIDPLADSYTLTGLNPQTSYTMRLRAVNDRGTGTLESFTALTDIDPNAPIVTPGSHGVLTTQLISALSPASTKRKEQSFTRGPSQPQALTAAPPETTYAEDGTNTAESSRTPRSHDQPVAQSDATATVSAKGISYWWLLLLPILIGGLWVFKATRSNYNG